MARMENSHRMVLQLFMWKKIFPVARVSQMYNECCRMYAGTSNDRNGLQQFIETINDNIRPFNMEIRQRCDEDDGTHYFALVNTHDCPLSRLSVDYNPDELEYFKLIVDTIVTSGNGCLSSITALNLINEDFGRKMTKKYAENLIKCFTKDMWLSEKDGILTLSTRSLMELNPYLLKIYEDIITFCFLCKEILLQGYICQECKTKVHKHCLSQFSRGINITCPRCLAADSLQKCTASASEDCEES